MKLRRLIATRAASASTSPIFDRGTSACAWRSRDGAPSSDHYVEKRAASSFQDTGLGDRLVAHQIDTLTLAGYMTHNCDAATVYGASERGLQVEVLADATGALPYANRAGAATAEGIATLRSGLAPEHDDVLTSHLRARAKD